MKFGRGSAVVAITGVFLCLPAYGQTPAGRAERELLASANQARLAQGLAPLKWDEGLAAAARRHAEVMARHGAAEHGFDGEPSLPTRARQAGAHFTWLSENVTQGTTAESIHSAFMKSASHRANILDGDMDSIGVGVAEQNGQLFAVEDFAKAR